MTYSDAEYTLTVSVVDNAGTFEIDAIVAKRTQKDNGTADSEKVDPTPGDSDMIFTNTFKRNKGGDPKTQPALSISKETTGKYADLSQYFNFTLTVTPNSLDSTTQFKGYILNKSNVNVTAVNNTEDGMDVNGDYILFPAGEPITFGLKHDERIVFVDTIVGTVFEATELLDNQADKNYKPNISLTVNGVTTAINGTKGTALGTGSKLVGEGKNAADYTNERMSNPLTGLLMDNLPFVGLILLAIGAFAMFVVVKRRARRPRRAANA